MTSRFNDIKIQLWLDDLIFQQTSMQPKKCHAFTMQQYSPQLLYHEAMQ